MQKKIKIFTISNRIGETPEDVECEINKLLAKYPDAILLAGGNFIAVVYTEEKAIRIKFETEKDEVLVE